MALMNRWTMRCLRILTTHRVSRLLTFPVCLPLVPTSTRIHLVFAPVLVTLTKIGPHFVVDATPEEEACMSASVVVAVTPAGQIRLMIAVSCLTDGFSVLQRLCVIAAQGRRGCCE